MTKDELIEKLAREHRSRQAPSLELEPWDDLEDAAKGIWREEILRLWPLIVEFVADWMEGGGAGHLNRDIRYDAADAWRREMT